MNDACRDLKTMPRTLRLLYAAGPGDVIGTFEHWRAGRDDPSEVAVTYSSQFYDVARGLGAKAVVIGSHGRRGSVRDANIRVEHRPCPRAAGGRLRRHLACLWWELRLIATAIANRTDVAVISDCQHWWMMRPLRWLGVRVVPSLHCVFRPRSRNGPLSALQKMDLAFLVSCPVILAVSDQVVDQMRSLVDASAVHFRTFSPHYRTQVFEAIEAPTSTAPFNVLFAGRIESNKGIFDLLDVARRFKVEGRNDIEFDVCGTGSDFDQLKADVETAGLSGRFRCHGHVQQAKMREMYSRSDVIVVPTRSDFVEGFNKVVAEAVLAGRPVVTSAVCPAISSVRAAVVEVLPDDVDGYAKAIAQLRDDAGLYEAKRQASLGLRTQFFDASRGWGATLVRALQDLGLAHVPAEAHAHRDQSTLSRSAQVKLNL